MLTPVEMESSIFERGIALLLPKHLVMAAVCWRGRGCAGKGRDVLVSALTVGQT